MRSSLRAVGRASLPRPRPRRSRCLLSVTLTRNFDLRSRLRHANALEGTRVGFWSRRSAGLLHCGLGIGSEALQPRLDAMQDRQHGACGAVAWSRAMAFVEPGGRSLKTQQRVRLERATLSAGDAACLSGCREW